jgi:hypothetical protein
MKKIIFLLCFFASLLFSAPEGCSDTYSVGSFTYYFTGRVEYDSTYSTSCVGVSFPPYRGCDFFYGGGAIPSGYLTISYNTYTLGTSGYFCTYEYYKVFYSLTPPEPEPEDNETCPESEYANSPTINADGSCLNCSDKTGADIPKCICEGIGDSYSGIKHPVGVDIEGSDGKCYRRFQTECDFSEGSFYYYEPIACPSDDNETNGSTPSNPDDNTTDSNDNSTNPSNPDDNTTDTGDNGTNPGGSPGGDPGGSPGGDPGGSPGGEPGGNPGGDPGSGGLPGLDGNSTGNTTGDNNETNGTCDGAFGEFNCLDSGKIKTVKDEDFFDVLFGHYNDVMNQYNDLKSLFDGGFEYHAPNMNYSPSSVSVFGKQITFDTCTPVGRISPIFRFMVTCLGYILALKILFWRL